MRTTGLNLLRFAAPVLPFGVLRQISGHKLLIPFYHIVSDENPAHIRHLYPVRTVSQFKADLAFLVRHYEPVSLHDIHQSVVNRKPFTRHVFHLTFDDGLRECHDIIAPVLREMGIPATFFLNPPFLDNLDLMFRYKASLLEDIRKSKGLQPPYTGIEPLKVGYADRRILDEMAQAHALDFGAFLSTRRPYMTKDEARRLMADGFTLGSHSLDHPLYTPLPLIEQLRQTRESQALMDALFKPACKVFAFPFTDDGVGLAFFEAMVAEGIDLTFGGAGIKRDNAPNHLQRLGIEPSGMDAQSVITAAYAAWCLKALWGRNVIRRS